MLTCLWRAQNTHRVVTADLTFAIVLQLFETRRRSGRPRTELNRRQLSITVLHVGRHGEIVYFDRGVSEGMTVAEVLLGREYREATGRHIVFFLDV